MLKSTEFTWVNNSGEKIAYNELNEAFNAWFKKVESELPEPPKDLREFEDRLSEYLDSLYERTFGYAYYLSSDKTLRNDTSLENLININIENEKTLKKKKTVQLNCIHDGYRFLKLALEKNFPFKQYGQQLLGLHLDLSGLTKPQQNVTAVQCAAQVLWYLKKSDISTIEAMTDKLLDRKQPFFDLLELGRFHNPRTIQEWVRAMCPIPQDQRKKRRSKDFGAFESIIAIPDIFTASGINFPRLRFAIICITRVMKTLGNPMPEVLASRPIALLAELLRFYPKLYVRDWVEEACSSNGSIYLS